VPSAIRETLRTGLHARRAAGRRIINPEISSHRIAMLAARRTGSQQKSANRCDQVPSSGIPFDVATELPAQAISADRGEAETDKHLFLKPQFAVLTDGDTEATEMRLIERLDERGALKVEEPDSGCDELQRPPYA